MCIAYFLIYHLLFCPRKVNSCESNEAIVNHVHMHSSHTGLLYPRNLLEYWVTGCGARPNIVTDQ